MSPPGAALRTVLAVLGFALALCAGRAEAQPGGAAAAKARSSKPREAPPAPEASERERELVRYRLANGLRVVLDVDRSESSLVVCLTLGVGTRHEPEGKDGAAWLLSRRDEFESRGSGFAKASARLRAASGTSSAELHADHTQFVTRVPPAELDLALQLAGQRLTRPRANTALFATSKAAALRELEREHTPSLEELGERRLRQLVFQGLWPHAHAGLGSAQGIGALLPADLERLHERFVRPASAVLSISGLFSEREARRLIQERLGSLPGRSPEPSPEDVVPRQTSERFNASIDRRATTPLAFYAWPIPSPLDADPSSVRLLAQIVSDSARLRAAGASGSPDIDDVRGWLLSPRAPTALAVRLRINARSTVDKARTVLERELERLAGPGPTESELEQARAQVSTELEAALDSAVARAAALGAHELHGGDARAALREALALARVESADVRQAARANLNETRRTSVELYPPGWPQDLPPEVVRKQHIVKAGENLIQIANRYHSSVDAIAAANRIKTHRFIFPGQELVIPIKTADVERAKKRRYTVRSGDTLMGIAARFGVTTRALSEANGRRRDQPIRIGETLVLPDAPREAVAAQKARAKLRQHRVKRGDSLLGLAHRYGVSAAEIAAANGRRPNQPILAGELLVIPSPARGEGPAPSAPKRGGSRPSSKALPKGKKK